MKRITEFRNDYFFLSNFYPCDVTYGTITYTSSEAAYQAQKTDSLDMRRAFSHLKAFEAKKQGRRLTMRPDFETEKFNIMYEILKAKFTQNEDLKQKLLDTDAAYLEEGNDWGDTTWGTVNGIGNNCLGHLLMKVRSELKGE